MIKITGGREKLDVVPFFCYLGEFLFSNVGCELASTTKFHFVWGKFNEPTLTPRLFSTSSRVRQFVRQGRYAPCKRNLGPNSSDLHRLQHNDCAMIRWMCRVTNKDQVRWQDLIKRMQSGDLEKVLHTRRLRWLCRTYWWLAEESTEAQSRRRSWSSEVIRLDCLALGLLPSNRKACSGTPLRSARG